MITQTDHFSSLGGLPWGKGVKPRLILLALQMLRINLKARFHWRLSTGETG